MGSYLAGRGQQKEITSSFHPYDVRYQNQSNKRCWIVTTKLNAKTVVGSYLWGENRTLTLMNSYQAGRGQQKD
ncbi:hypothetical protein NC652_003386 [Populus alba x Populus x berolinensis]|nr:hypothetical protein NC652_003386 [Populus alba x Populus x berolinensis]